MLATKDPGADRRARRFVTPWWRPLFLLLLAAPAEAQTTTTWSNAGGDGLWSNASNWSGGLPTSGDTTALLFINPSPGGALTLTQDLGNPFLLNTLSIVTSTTNSLTLQGNPLQFTGTGATLQLTSTAATAISTVTVAAPITIGGSSLTLNSTGNTAALTVSGAISSTGSGPAVLLLAGTSTNVNNRLSGVVSDGPGGAVGIYKTGTGIWTLTNAANSFSGGVTVAQGTLRFGSPGALGSPSGTIQLGDAGGLSSTLSYAGASTATLTHELALSGTGLKTLYSTTASLIVSGTISFRDAAAQTIELSGNVSDTNELASLLADNGAAPVGLQKSGSPTWIVSNANNSFSGGVSITLGELRVTDLAAQLNMDQNNLRFTATTGAVGVLETAGSITNSLGAGAGQIRFGTGGVTFNSGGFSAFGGDLDVTLNNDAATPIFWGGVSGSTNLSTSTELQFNSGHADGVVNLHNALTLGSGTHRILVVDNTTLGAADRAQLSGTISGSGGLYKLGSGVLVVSGSNSYTGGTSIASGAVRAASPAANLNLVAGGGYLKFTGTNNGTAGVLETSGTLTNAVGSAAGQISWSNNGSGGFAAVGGPLGVTLNNDAATPLVWNSGGFITGTAGELVLSSTNADSVVTVNNAINLNGLTRTVRVFDNSAVKTDYAVLSGTISNGALIKQGAGLLAITGSNTFTGGLSIAGGVVRVNSVPGTLNQSPLRFHATAASGAILETSGTLTNAVGTGLDQINWGAINATTGGSGGFSAFGGALNVTLNADAVTPLVWNSTPGFVATSGELQFGSIYSDDVVTFNNPIDLNNAVRTIRVNDNPDTIADYTVMTGSLSSNVTASGGLIKQGAGTLVLTGESNFTGSTSVRDGTLQLGNGGTTGNLAGVIRLTNAGNPTAPALIFNHASIVNFGGPGSIISGNGGGVLITGPASGGVQFNTANTYTQATTIDVGTLRYGIANAVAVGNTLVINSTGTLDLNGFNGGLTTLSGGGVIANSALTPAVLSLSGGNFTGTFLESGGTLALTKLGAGTLTLGGGANNYSGGLTLGGTGTLFVPDGSYLGSGSITFSGGTLETAAADMSIAAAVSLSGNVTFTGNTTFTFDSPGMVNVTGAAALNNATTVGPNGLVFQDDILLGANLALSGNQDLVLNGNIHVSGGARTITVANVGGHTFNTTFNLSADGLSNTLTLRSTTPIVVAGAITDSGFGGALTVTGAAGGSVTISNTSNAFSGGVTLGANGLLITPTVGVLGSGTLRLNGGTLQNDAAQTYTNALSFGGSVTLSGSQSLTLAPAGGLATVDASTTIANQLGAGLTVNGDVQLNANLSIAAVNPIVLNGSLLVAGATRTFTNLANGSSVNGINLAADGVGHQLDLRGTATSVLLVNGPVSGDASSLLRVVSGTSVFNATGTYQGQTMIFGTMAVLGADNVFGTTGTVMIAGASVLQSDGLATRTLANPITLSSSPTFGGESGLVLSGDISPTLNSRALTFTGGGEKTLSGNLILGDAVAARTLTISGNTGGGIVRITGTVKDGPVVGGALAFTLTNRVVELSGFSQHTGRTTIVAGAVRLANGFVSVLGSAPTVFSGSNGTQAVIETSGSLTPNVGTAAGQVSWGAGLGGGFAAYGGPLDVTLNNDAVTPLVWNGTAGFLSTGELQLSSNTSDDTVTLNNRIDLTNGSRTIRVFDGAADADAVITGVLFSTTTTAGGSLTKQGAGKLVLTGSNTYLGTTTVAEGTLQIGNGGSVGQLSAASTVNVLSGAALVYDRTASLAQSTIAGPGDVTISVTGGTLTVTNFNPTGLSTVRSGTLQVGGGKNAAFGAANVVVNSGSQLRVSTTGNLTFSAGLSGGGTLVFSNTSSVSGTIITYLGNSMLTGGTTLTGNLATLRLGDGVTAGAGEFAGNVAITSSNGSLIFNRPDDFAFNGVISGNGQVRQQGGGVLTLAGNNSYSGATSVASGTMRVTGALGNTPITVAAGATFDLAAGASVANSTAAVNVQNNGTIIISGTLGAGNGTLNSNAVLRSINGTSGGAWTVDGGIIELGGAVSNTIASLHLGGLTFTGAGGTVNFNLDAPATSSASLANLQTSIGDRLTIDNLPTIGAPSIFNLTGGSGTAAGYYLLMSGYSGTISNLGALTINAPTGFGKQLFNLDGELFLQLTQVSNLVWAGTDAGGGQWDVSTASWNGGAVYSDVSRDAVLFDDSATGTTSVNIVGTGVQPTSVVVNNTNLTYTFSGGAIAGDGGLTKSGSGLLTLLNDNTFTGGLQITGGTVQLGDGGTTGGIAASTQVAFDNGGVLRFNRSDALMLGGNISGTGSIVTAGTGTLILTGNNTYVGATTVGGGTLSIEGAGVYSELSSLTVQSGTFAVNGSTAQIVSNLTVNAAGDLRVNSAALTVTNLLVDGGQVNVGASALTASSLTVANNGLVNVGAGGLATPLFAMSSGTLDVAGNTSLTAVTLGGPTDTSGGPQAIINVTASNTLTLAGNLTYTANNNAATDAFGAVIQGPGLLSLGGALRTFTVNDSANTDDELIVALTMTGTLTAGFVKSGSGTLYLSAANNLSSTNTLSAGTLKLGHNNALGSGRLNAGGGTLRGDGAPLTLSNVIALAGNLNIGGASDLLLAGTVINFTGNRTLTISNSATTTISTLQLSESATGRVLTLAGSGRLVVDSLTSGTATSGGGLIVAGSGLSLTLNNANNYVGTTSLRDGTVFLGDGGAFGTATNAIVVSTATNVGSPRVLTTAPITIARDFTVLGGTGATVTFGGQTAVTSTFGGSITFSQTLNLTATAGGTVVFAGALTGSTATAGVNVLGDGKIVLAGTNTYTGTTYLIDGTLQVGNGGTSGSIVGNVTGSPGTAVIFNRSDSYTYSGSVSGSSLGLTKLGAGTLTLAGNNDYGGQTSIGAGTLLLTGTLGNTHITVGGGATFAGTGRHNGNLTVVSNGGTLGGDLTFASAVSSSGTIAPGLAGVGTLTAHSLYLWGGALDFELAAPGVNDRLVLTSTIAPQVFAQTALNFSNLAGYGLGTYSLISGYTGQLTSTGFGLLSYTSSLGGFGLSLQNNAGTLDLLVSNIAGTNTLVWTGATDGTWNTTSTNWSGVATTFTNGRDVVFDHTASTTSISISGTVMPKSVLVSNNSGQTHTFFTGTISGSGGLTKDGAGILVLANVNTYTGGTTISEGALQIGNGSSLGSITGNIVDNSLLIVNKGTTLTLNGLIGGTGGILKTGTGALILTADNTFAGMVTVAGGTLQIGVNGTSGNLAGGIINNATLVFNRSDTFTYAGVIGGTGTLSKMGTGTLVLTSSQNYSGTTSVGGGTLVVQGGQIGFGSANAYVGTTSTLTGALMLTSGAVVSLSNAYVGHFANSTGTAVVSGSGSLLSTVQDVFIGNLGNGSLVVNNSGQVTSRFTYVGFGSSAVGTAVVDGAASNWSSQNLYVGYSGTGSLNVQNGATVTGTGSGGKVGYLAGSTGTVLISGTGSQLIRTSGLTIGQTGRGNVTVSDGGLIRFSSGYLGFASEGVGTATIDGVGSKWTTSAGLVIGESGQGSLTVQNGGLVQIGDGQLGTVSGGSGSVVVLGLNSQFSTTYDLILGGTSTAAGGAASITATAGGAVNVGRNTTVYDTATVNLGVTGRFTTQSLILDGGTLNFELGALSSSAFINLTGTSAPTINALTNLGFSSIAGFGTGTYHLISGYSGLISSTGFGLLSSTLSLGGYNLTLQNNSGMLDLLVSSLSVTNNLVWVGGANNVWDTTTANWTGDANTFGNDQSNVTFSNGSVTDVAVAAAGVRPVNMTVNNDASHDYMFSGGAITSAGTLTKQGAGSLVFTNDVTFSAFGGAQISGGGTLQIGDGGSTGSFHGNISGDGAVVFNRAGTVTYDDVIYSAASVTQAGPGTLILTNDGNLFGTMAISSGTLQLGNGGTSGRLFGLATVANNGVLAFNRSDAVSLGNVISGSGGVVQAGTGTTVLTGENTYTGGTTVNAGTLQIGFGETGSIVGDVRNNGVVKFNRFSGPYTFGGVISGTGAVAQAGVNQLIFTGDHTYTGVTTVSSTLQLGNGGTSGSVRGDVKVTASGNLIFNRSDSVTYSGSITATGGVMQAGTGSLILTGNNTFSGGLVVASGAVQIGNGTSTGILVGNITDNALVRFQPGAPFVYGNRITGSGGVMVASGTLILTNTNAYSGGTTIVAGATLQLGNNSGTGSVSGGIVNDGTLVLSRSGAFTLTNAVSGLGGMLMQGTSTVSIAGTNTYVGGTTIASGTLQLGAGSTSGSIVGDVVLAGGKLAFNRSDLLTLNGAISGSGGILQVGVGSTVLTGSNTFTGGVTIANGALRVADLNANLNLANNNLRFAGTSTSSAVLEMSGNLTNSIGPGFGQITWSNTSSGGFSAVGGNLNVQLNGGATLVWGNSGFMSASGALVFGSANSDALTTFQNNINLTNGSRTISVVDNPNSTADAAVISGVLSSSSSTAGVFKTGFGTLILTGNNTYAGYTTVNQGTLQLGNGGTSGNLSGTISMMSAGTVVLNRSDDFALPAVVTGAGTLIKNGSNTVAGTNFTGTGAVVVNDGTLVVNGTYSPLTTQLTSTTSQLRLNVSSSLSTMTVTSAVSGLGSLMKAGSGTTMLMGANSFSGGTTISDGMLKVGLGGTVGSLGGNVANFGTLMFSRSDTLTFVGAISGTGQLRQNGFGMLTLAGNNTYSGATSVMAGTLNVTGTVANSAVAVASGAALTGSGYLGNSATVASGGTLSGQLTIAGAVSSSGSIKPGSGGFGTLSVGALVLNGGSLNFDLGSILGSDRIAVTGFGAPTVSQTTSLNFTAFGGFGVGTYQLISGYTGLLTATDFGRLSWTTVLNGFNLSLQNNSGALDLIVSNLTGTSLVWSGAVSGTWDGATANWTGDAAVFNNGVHQVTFDNTSSAATVTVAAGGVSPLQMTVNSSTLRNYLFTGGAVTSAGALVKQGTSTLTFADAASFAGGATVSGGTLQIGNGGTSGSFTGDIRNSGTVVFNRSDALTYSGVISGSGSVRQTGSGMLTMAGLNTYVGATSVASGTMLVAGSLGNSQVSVASGATFGGTGSVGGSVGVQSGGSLQGSLTIAGAVTSSGSITPGTGGVGTLSVGSLLLFGGSLNYELGSVAASDQIVVSGTAAPSIFAATNFNLSNITGFGPGLYHLITGYSGLLSSTSFGYLSTPSTLGGFNLLLQNNSGALDLLVGSLSGTTAALWTGAGANGSWSNAANWGGALPESGPTTTILFDGTTGTTSLNQDLSTPFTLNSLQFVRRAGATFTLSGGDLAFAGANATILYNGTGVSSSSITQTIGTNIIIAGDNLSIVTTSTGYNTLRIVGNISTTNTGPTTLTLAASTSATNYVTGSITNGSGTLGLIKTDAGMWVLSGTNAFTGGLTVQGGTLRFTSAASLGVGSTITLGSAQTTGTISLSLGAGPAVLTQTIRLDGITTTAGGSIVNDALSSTSTVALLGAVEISNTSKKTLTLGGGNLGANAVSGRLADGAGSAQLGLAKSGTGLWVVTNTGNSFTGGITISGGVLRAVDPAALNLPNNFVYMAGSTLTAGVLESAGSLTIGVGSGTGKIYWTGSGGFSAFGGSLDVTLNNDAVTPIVWNGTSQGMISATGSLALSSTVADNVVNVRNAFDFGGGVRTVQVYDNPSVAADYAVLSGTLSNGSLNKTGGGTLVLTASNGLSGTSTVAGGALVFGNDRALGTSALRISGTSTLLADTARTIDNRIFLGGNLIVGGTQNLTLTGLISLNSGSRTLTVANNGIVTVNNVELADLTGTSRTLTLGGNGTLFVQGAMTNGSGTGNLMVAMSATSRVVMNGTNTYTGPTTVAGGTLVVNGSLASPLVALTTPTAGLGGTGALAGTVTSSGSISPGDGGVGTLTVGALVLNGGALNFELAEVLASDRLAVSGGAAPTVNGLTSLNFTTLTGFGAGTYQLISGYSGLLSTTDFGRFSYTSYLNGYTLQLLNGAGSLDLLVGSVSSSNLVWTGAADGLWNTSSANWSGTSSVYADGQDVQFGNITGVTTITVAAAGVAPASMTVDNDTAHNYLFAGGAITSTGMLTKQGVGALILTNDVAFAGGANVVSGTLQIGNGGTTGSFTGDIVNNGRVLFKRSDVLVYSGDVSGTGGITQTGSGTTVLSGSNSFTGGVTIAAGSLRAVDPQANLNLANNNLAFSGTGGATPVFETAGTFTAGVGSGAGQVRWTGHGGFAAVGGTLDVTLGGDAATPFAWGAANYASLGKELVFGSVNSDAVTTFRNNLSMISADGVIRVIDNPNSSADVALLTGNVVTSTVPQTLTKTGDGTLVMTGAFNGFTYVNVAQGTFQLGNGAAGHNSADLYFTLKGGTLALNQSDDLLLAGTIAGTGAIVKYGSNTVTENYLVSTATVTIHDGTLASGNAYAPVATSLTSPSSRLLLNPSTSTSTMTVASNLSGSGSLVKSGSGTVFYTGSASHTGGTTVSSGVLSVGVGGASGSLTGAVSLSSSAVLRFNRSDDVTFAGSIGGSGDSVVKLGGNTLTFTGANTYTAATSVASGVLRVAGSLGNTPITVGTGAQLQIAAGASTGTGTIQVNNGASLQSEGVSGGNVVLSAGGSLFPGLSGIATMTVGGLTLNGGNLYFQFGAPGTNDRIVLAGGAAPVIAGPTALNVLDVGGLDVGTYTLFSGYGSNVIAGADLANLTLNSVAGLNFSLDNTHAGRLDLIVALSNARSLIWNASASTSWNTSDTNWTNDGAPVAYSDAAHDAVLFNDAGGGGEITVAAPVAPDSVVFANTTAVTYTLSGAAVTGTGGLAKNGDGLVVLANENSYTGVTQVNAGTLQIGGGGTSGSIASAQVFNKGVVVFNRSDDSAYAGVISGTGSVVKNGDGVLALSGAQQYSGGTTVNDGVLRLTDNGALPTTGGWVVAGGLVDIAGNLSQSTSALSLGSQIAATTPGVQIGAGLTLTLGGNVNYVGSADQGAVISGSGTLHGGAAGRTFSVAENTNAADDLTVAASLAGANWSKTGAGTLYLAGQNVVSGTFTLSAGTLAVGNNSALGTAVLRIGGSTTLRGDGLERTLANNISLSNNATLTIGGNSNLNLLGKIYRPSGNGSLVVNNSAVTTLSQVVIASGSTNQTLTLGGSGSVVIHSIVDTATSTGAGNLIFNGSGTVALNGANAYLGNTTIRSGAVLLGHADALGTSTAAVTVVSSTSGVAPQILTNDAVTVARDFNVLSGTGAGPTFGGATAVTSTFSGNITFSQSINFSAVAGGRVFFDGTLDDRGTVPLGINILGAGTIVLNGANLYTGLTTVASGTLIANSQLAGQVVVLEGATFTGSGSSAANLDVSGGTSNISDVQSGMLNVSAGTVNLEAGASAVGGVNVAGGSVVVAAGAQIVNSDPTNVTGGVLDVNGSVSGVVNVVDGGSLKGSGTVGGLTIGSGGTFAPGNSVGNLTVDGGDVDGGSTVQIAGGANVVFEFRNAPGTAPGTDWDHVDLGNGVLDLSAASPSNRIVLTIDSWKLDNSGHGGGPGDANFNQFRFDRQPVTTYEWLFIETGSLANLVGATAETINDYFKLVDDDVDSGVFGTGNPYFRPLDENGDEAYFSLSWKNGLQGTGLYITFTAVPEPGSIVLAGLASLGAGWYGRRRRNRAAK